ncbi:MAG: response regulator [Planctomycetaceae bacterium]|nr:response regulator [Planctomycetaceae bacterium]
MADDDAADRELTQEAWDASKLANPLRFVENGRQLLDYLRHQGKFSDPASAPRPGIILLDLNMPVMDGREALKEIKRDEHLRRIPVVIMTTSEAEQDIVKSYDLGAAAYVIKPVTFERMTDVVKTIEHFWVEIVKLAPAK